MSAGNFVVAWDSLGQDGSGYGIYAQRFDFNGNPTGAEFRANSYTTSFQDSPTVAMNGAGNFVVTWNSSGQDGDLVGIYAQRYDANGSPIGSEFQVNTYTTGAQFNPVLAMNSSGNFLVVWESAGQDGSGYGIYAQRYAPNGAPAGGEFRVNSTTANHQFNSAVAMDAAGNCIIVWQSGGQDGSGDGIYGQRYDTGGNPLGSEFRVNTFTTNDQHHPAVAMDAAGNFVVVWSSMGQDGDVDGVFAQRYDGAGNPLGVEFQVNTYTTNIQFEPAVAIEPRGNFVVSWSSNLQDGSNLGIYAQRYDHNGIRIGNEFRINTFTDSYQERSALAMTNGRWVVAWDGDGQDGSNTGVFMKLFVDGYFIHLPLIMR